MHILPLIRPLVWALALFGLVALVLCGMLAVPLSQPPELASIHEGAVAIGTAGQPPVTQFQARDGTVLAYRLYPAAQGAADRLAILVHGSAGNSRDMRAVASALAEANVAAVAIDTRGHGASGTRGDIGYLGQLDDDLDDLIAELRPSYPAAKLILVGHSLGGGFALRIASQAGGHAFARVVLLAPYLGYSAPTNRPANGPGRWADADIPRIMALMLLRRVGIDWADAMPVIAYATAPGSKAVTPRYSFRLLANFGPPRDWKAAFAAVSVPIDIIVGDNDELMDAPRYRDVAAPVADKVDVELLPHVDHMGIVYRPAALAAIVAAARQ